MQAGVFAQNELAPCCGIIKIDAVKNMVTARDKITGQLYQFKADALDIKAIKVNDAVTMAFGKITSIGGAKRTYVTVKSDYQEPCCGVVSVQVDGLAPCCVVVTIKNNSTNNNFSISVPKQIAATLKTGQAVSIDAANNLAVVQSSYGGNGEMNSYGYPATSADDNPGNGNNSDKWVITPVPTIKGVLGR